MTREEEARMTHHDLRLSQQLSAHEMGQRKTAYGIRYKNWLRDMKLLHPEIPFRYWKLKKYRGY